MINAEHHFYNNRKLLCNTADKNCDSVLKSHQQIRNPGGRVSTVWVVEIVTILLKVLVLAQLKVATEFKTSNVNAILTI